MSEPITRKLTFFFPECECEKPIVCKLIKDFDLTINIFRAKVTPDDHGYLVLDVTGTEDNIRKGLEYVQTFDVRIDDGIQGLVWNSEKCTHCGHCLTICPTAALHITDAATREVTFDSTLCVECLACIPGCPYDACSAAY